MKKSRLLLGIGAIAVALSCGAANAAPLHAGSRYTDVYRTQHVQPAPRPVARHGGGHHHSHHGGGHAVVVTHPHHHHHHHHSNTAGNIILATALLISAFM